MKILHIGLTEHDTLHDLMDSFFSEQPKGSKFVSTKKEAEAILKKPNNKVRVFYSKAHSNEWGKTFELTEAIID